MKKILTDLGVIFLIIIISTLFVWLPFALGLIGNGMFSIFANYDGPNYLIIAKSLYDKALIATTFSLPTPVEYYPAHLPAYPLLIRFFNQLLPGPWAMLWVTVLSTIFAAGFFYLLVKKFCLSSNPLWLSIFFLFLPARWLVVRTIGSPEPLFIGALLASFYFFKSAFDKKENNLIFQKKSVMLDLVLAGAFGALAQITKSPGILLFVGYELYLIIKILSERKTNSHLNNIYYLSIYSLPLLLIPLSALLVFGFYQIKVGDFWAYFHSGDNFHLVFPPFQSFITGRNWIGDFWLEDMVWQYLIGALAVVQLIKLKHFDLAAFAGVFFTATLFVAHRDLSRYSLPLMPFALIAFAPFLEKKEFKIAFFFVLIPIYLYTINFILHNTAPIADWTPYL
jgi:hypothetical protein